jgi:hypothetical protein
MSASAISLLLLEDDASEIRQFLRLTGEYTWKVSVGSEVAVSKFGREASKSCPRHADLLVPRICRHSRRNKSISRRNAC